MRNIFAAFIIALLGVSLSTSAHAYDEQGLKDGESIIWANSLIRANIQKATPLAAC